MCVCVCVCVCVCDCVFGVLCVCVCMCVCVLWCHQAFLLLPKVKKLVDCVDVNCRDEHGRNSTPLHLAGIVYMIDRLN